MKLLITGANGQLGQDLQKECGRRGIKYIPTDYLAGSTSRVTCGINDSYDVPQATSHQKNADSTNPTICQPGNLLTHLDITDLKSVREAVLRTTPDAIINCAAYNAVDKAEDDWKNAFLVNSIGPKNLAIAASEHGIPLMHFSTDYVFDGKKGSPYFVWDEPKPLSKYGQSKLYGEQLVWLFTKRYFIVRLSWVFGVGNTNFVKKILEWSKEKDELKVVDDQISSPAYTVDLSKAILDLLSTECYGIYHMANTGYCSRYDWAKYILELSGWKGRLIPAKSSEFKTAAQRPEFSAMDTFPLEETIGYELPNWRDATERFLKELEVFG
ncbi:dTDP-4-dehydrorhamnose reductase [Mesotoga sp. UBA5825]|uniref:dTDP-4-dehydrorhamnose reductase n=1 Tax=Mesotoga sp. UBA5825 TaxID=1946858 RepID=UPI0025E1D5C8|nr:dTDP-4-dehydrorhamnose reductase [Mesotoga sp. UBA5825]